MEEDELEEQNDTAPIDSAPSSQSNFDDFKNKTNQEKNRIFNIYIESGQLVKTSEISNISYYKFEGENFPWAKCISCQALISTNRGGNKSNNFDPDMVKFPSTYTIKCSIDKEYGKVIGTIKETIRSKVLQGEANLVIDFGRYFHDFLSVFITILDDQQPPQLRVLPFAFKSTVMSKTAENVRDLIMESGEKFGFTEEEMASLTVVSDGARNLEKMGTKYFKNWIKCSCHLIQKISERTVEPLSNLLHEFDPSDMEILRESRECLERTAHLSHIVHLQKNKISINKLPQLFVATRWQSAVQCGRDILEILPSLVTAADQKVRVVASEFFNKDHVMLKIIVDVLDKFEPLLYLFEKSAVTIHLFLPKMSALLKHFKEVERHSSSSDKVKAVLAKSARIHIEHYLKENIGHIHAAATMLCPKIKKMTKLDTIYKDMALEKIREMMQELVPLQQQQIPTDDVDCYDEYVAPQVTDELSQYLNEIVTATETDDPLVYWSQNANRFPNLSRVARKTFSLLSSESVCERSFSVVKKIVSSDRNRLDPEMIEKLMITFFFRNERK